MKGNVLDHISKLARSMECENCSQGLISQGRLIRVAIYALDDLYIRADVA